MDVTKETQKRHVILNQITNEINDLTTGVVLGGSMAYGQNYSVSKDSDIDLALIINKENIDNFVGTKYFNNKISTEILDLFRQGEINLFWITQTIDDVEVNCFIYESESYKNFCLLKEDIRGYIQSEPSKYHTCYGFNGKQIKFKRYVAQYKDGFIYERPTLADNKYWIGPLRSDYLFGHITLHQENEFVDEVEKIVWDVTLNQLIKEYGNKPDLTRVNILNAYFVYQEKPEKIPQDVINKIKMKTERKLRLL